MTEQRRPERPSLRAAFANWGAYDAPFTERLRLALRNNWTKLRRRQDCCGRDGEPGC